MITHSSRLFAWHRETREFTADVSSLGPIPFSQPHADAADEGFQMVSHRTSAIAKFVVVKRLYSKDVDRELQGWVLMATQHTVQAQPYLRGVRVTVFNT